MCLLEFDIRRDSDFVPFFIQVRQSEVLDIWEKSGNLLADLGDSQGLDQLGSSQLILERDLQHDIRVSHEFQKLFARSKSNQKRKNQTQPTNTQPNSEKRKCFAEVAKGFR